MKCVYKSWLMVASLRKVVCCTNTSLPFKQLLNSATVWRLLCVMR
jgi:hypothetical protein